MTVQLILDLTSFFFCFSAICVTQIFFFVLTNNKGTLHSEPLCLNILNLALVLSTTTIKWSGVRRTSSITNNFFFLQMTLSNYYLHNIHENSSDWLARSAVLMLYECKLLNGLFPDVHLNNFKMIALQKFETTKRNLLQQTS